MEPVRTVEVLGPPWVMITIAVISLGGVVVTALVGPLVVERFKSGRTTPISPESSAIAQLANEAVKFVTVVQSSLTDLQTRIRQLEVMQMTDAHD
jgi:TolA-binding protein